MLTAIQIVLLAFVIFAISRVYFRAKEKILSPQTYIFWMFIWLAAAFGIIQPGTTSKLAEIFGVGRGVDIIVYIALALVFYLVFRIYVMVEDLRHEITFIVRQVALRKTSTIRHRKKPKRR